MKKPPGLWRLCREATSLAELFDLTTANLAKTMAIPQPVEVSVDEEAAEEVAVDLVVDVVVVAVEILVAAAVVVVVVVVAEVAAPTVAALETFPAERRRSKVREA